MTEEIQPVQDPIVETPPVVEVAPPVVEEKTYTYQPKDESGNNLGAPQVIKYKSEQELAEKLQEQNVNLIRLNRKLTRDMRLGNIVKEEIPDSAPRVKEGQYDFTPKPLTAEERLQLSQDLTDPEKMDAAQSRLVEATIGNPAEIRRALSSQVQRIAAIDAKEQAEAFVRSNPTYYVCQQNFETLANWMVKNELEPTKSNFELAFGTLGPAGAAIMVERPIADAAPIIPPPTVVPEAIIPPVTEVPRPQARPTASGLTRSNSSDTGPAPKKGYSQKELDKMSADEYRQKVLIPEFNARQTASRV